MVTRDILVAAVAIPVISLIAIKLTTKVIALIARIWRWFLRTIASQTAEAIREVVSPEFIRVRHDLMASLEELRASNDRDHAEVQRRLTGVEGRLTDVEVRLAAVEANTKTGE